MIEHKDIHEAINAVMGEVGYVQKQKSDKLSYTYLGEAGLIEALRPSMVEHGIYVRVKKINKIWRDTYTTKSGTPMISTVIHGVVRFTHVSGSYVDCDAIGEGADAGDKSANKAMTGMYKYAVRQEFMIETGDDPDQFSSDSMERATKVAKAPVESPQNAQEAPGATQTDKSGNGAVETAQALSDGFTGNQVLTNIELVQQIAGMVKPAGKKTVDVTKFLTKMEKGKKMTVQQIVNEIKGVENVEA